jgi:hypothetical protein
LFFEKKYVKKPIFRGQIWWKLVRIQHCAATVTGMFPEVRPPTLIVIARLSFSSKKHPYFSQFFVQIHDFKAQSKRIGLFLKN